MSEPTNNRLKPRVMSLAQYASRLYANLRPNTGLYLRAAAKIALPSIAIIFLANLARYILQWCFHIRIDIDFGALLLFAGMIGGFSKAGESRTKTPPRQNL